MCVSISGVCVYVSVCGNVIMSVCVCVYVSVYVCMCIQIKQHISKARVCMIDPQMYLSSSALAVSDVTISLPWQIFSLLNIYTLFLWWLLIFADICFKRMTLF